MQDRRRSFRATSADGVGTWGFRLDDGNAPTTFRIGKKRSSRSPYGRWDLIEWISSMR